MQRRRSGVREPPIGAGARHNNPQRRRLWRSKQTPARPERRKSNTPTIWGAEAPHMREDGEQYSTGAAHTSYGGGKEKTPPNTNKGVAQPQQRVNIASNDERRSTHH